MQALPQLLTREVPQQPEVELVPRAFVSDGDIGGDGPALASERVEEVAEKGDDDSDRDRQRHVRS